MNNAIVVEGLSKRFRRYSVDSFSTLKGLVVKRQLFLVQRTRQYIQVLKNITFSVPEGIVLGIIGPNGSGKTTLLSLLAGILRPDSGKISVKVEELSEALPIMSH